jgi:pimeloyl-ACP methyl ester carboxylesterase
MLHLPLHEPAQGGRRRPWPGPPVLRGRLGGHDGRVGRVARGSPGARPGRLSQVRNMRGAVCKTVVDPPSTCANVHAVLRQRSGAPSPMGRGASRSVISGNERHAARSGWRSVRTLRFGVSAVWVDDRAVRASVDESGRGNTHAVVLLHGLGTSGWMWHRIAPVLAEDFHVLVPDLPGHGRSGRAWVSLADTVDVVAEVVRSRTAAGRAHVVGLSLGGYVAALLAANEPAVVLSVVVSGVNVLPFAHPTMMRLFSRIIGPFATSGPMVRANAKALKVPAADFAGYRSAAKEVARGTFTRVGDEVTVFEVPAKAGSSPCRLLAVAGANENEKILQSLPVLAEGFARGEARLVPGVGHAWSGEAPELFAAMIRAHVADTKLPANLYRPVEA